MSASGIRARNRAAIEQEIIESAWRQLVADGAAALSLRAIARDLGMASSALYRYVASRDELLTRLIVLAYDSLGDAVDAALARAGKTASEQFATIATATRRWALEHPHQYALVYGSPVPGYAAPTEQTTPAGTRVQLRLIALLAAAEQRGQVMATPPAAASTVAHLTTQLALDDLDLSPGALARGLAAWTMVIGAISAELFEQFGPQPFADPDAYFGWIVDTARALVFEAPKRKRRT